MGSLQQSGQWELSLATEGRMQKFLIIDDERASAVCSTPLKRKGHEVVFTENGQAGLGLVRPKSSR